MNVQDLVHPESRDLVEERIKSGYSKPYEHLALRKEGSSFPVVEVLGNIIPYEGTMFRVTAIRDMTEHRRTEEALKRAHAELESLKKRLQKENIYLREEIKLEHNFENFIGQSTGVRQVFQKVEQVAKTNSTVLILGETGTGKELIARAVHNLSQYKDRPLVKSELRRITGESD